MIKKLLISIKILIVGQLILMSDLQASKLDEILDRVQLPITRYDGYLSQRQIRFEEKDPQTLKNLQVKLIRRQISEFHSKDRESMPLSCKVDGQDQDLSACKEQGDNKLIWPIFVKDTPHYRYRLVGETPDAWQIEVQPQQNTKQHFQGLAYVSRDYRLKKMQGTLADLPFGVKRLQMDIDFDTMQGYPVAVTGRYEVEVRFSFLLHKLFVSNFTASQVQLIPRDDAS